MDEDVVLVYLKSQVRVNIHFIEWLEKFFYFSR